MQGAGRRNPIIIRLEPRPAPSAPDVRGRRRRAAELNRLDQQIKILEMQGAARKNPNMTRLEPRPVPSAPDLRGIHHRFLELKRLDQQIKCLEEELENLDNTDRASTVCKEVLVTIDNKPDAFLPITNGPENAAWKQWFEKTTEPRGCGCCL